jgi:hypothetical protein
MLLDNIVLSSLNSSGDLEALASLDDDIENLV